MRRPDRQLPFPWKTFVRHHHGRRPTVFRDVLDRPLASSGEVFEAFLALMSGEHRSSALRIAGNGQRQLDLDLDMLPRSADRSVAGYVTRLSRRVSDPGIAVNHLQAGSSVLFGRVVPFLDALYSRIGVPTGGALLDLFAGTYRQSFVGLHKDEQDVFTFVLSGRKRFLLWPFETLADRFGVGEGARFRPHTLTEWGGRLETLRDDAIVVEAGPRDVIYWPSSYWHIAESDGAFVSTLALGIFPRTKPVLVLTKALEELRGASQAPSLLHDFDSLPYGNTRSARARSQALREQGWRAILSSPELRHQECLVHETWLSKMGFAHAPPRSSRRTVRRTDHVQVILPAAMRLVEPPAGELVLCAGGASLLLPRHGQIRALLRLLMQGKSHSVADLVRRFGDRGNPALADDLILYLITWLAESHVLVSSRGT